jgi:hypothetical protein
MLSSPASPLSAPAFFLDSPLLSEDNSDDIELDPQPKNIKPQSNGFDPQVLFSKLDIGSTFIKTEDSPQYPSQESSFFMPNPDLSMSSNGVTTVSPPSPQSLYNFQYNTNGPLESGNNQLLQPMNNFDSYSPSPTSPLSPGNELARIAIQPERYQVVNYNIHPAPEIEFNQQFTDPVTVQATLLYDNSVDVKEGFTNGDVQVLKVGTNKVSFPALHLNRMTPIKNSVQQSGALSSLSSSQKDAFCYSIRFKIGDLVLVSSTFKLVSACNQIPSGVDVRPRKNKVSSKMEPSDVQPHTQQTKVVATKTSSGKRRATNEAQEGTTHRYFF